MNNPFDVDEDETLHEAYIAYAENIGEVHADLEGFEDAYAGRWDSEQEYAWDLIDSCYDLDSLMGSLAMYFDYEAFARDLFILDYWSEDDGHGGVFVFRNI